MTRGGAVEQYAAADKLTPRWGRTHLKWGEALAKQGKRDEAKAQFALAATPGPDGGGAGGAGGGVPWLTRRTRRRSAASRRRRGWRWGGRRGRRTWTRGRRSILPSRAGCSTPSSTSRTCITGTCGAKKYFGDRLRIGLQLLAIAVGLALVIGAGALIWQAHESDGVVIEAFSAPPDLAAKGLTGQVLASQLQDRLNRLQAATNSARPEASYSHGWGEDVKVEIPETGVSIGELQRLLRGWLGHETKIGGEVYRTPTGLGLTVRASDHPGDEVTGGVKTIFRASCRRAPRRSTRPLNPIGMGIIS